MIVIRINRPYSLIHLRYARQSSSRASFVHLHFSSFFFSIDKLPCNTRQFRSFDIFSSRRSYLLMRKPTEARHKRHRFLHPNTFALALFTLYDIFARSRAFLRKTEHFSLHEYETARKNSNSSNLRAEGREIKFRAFQLYYIGGRENAYDIVSGMPKCSGARYCIFFFFESVANFRFSIFQFVRLNSHHALSIRSLYKSIHRLIPPLPFPLRTFVNSMICIIWFDMILHW